MKSFRWTVLTVTTINLVLATTEARYKRCITTILLKNQLFDFLLHIFEQLSFPDDCQAIEQLWRIAS